MSIKYQFLIIYYNCYKSLFIFLTCNLGYFFKSIKNIEKDRNSVSSLTFAGMPWYSTRVQRAKR